MNEPLNRYLAIGQEVIFIGAGTRPHHATVTEVLTERAVRLVSKDGQATSVSEYSETHEINTFHFPPAAKASATAEKKSEAKT